MCTLMEICLKNNTTNKSDSCLSNDSLKFSLAIPIIF